MFQGWPHADENRDAAETARLEAEAQLAWWQQQTGIEAQERRMAVAARDLYKAALERIIGTAIIHEPIEDLPDYIVAIARAALEGERVE